MTSQKQVFRFKFSPDILDAMKRFSEVNKFKKRDCFNENWDSFIKTHNSIIENEKKRLFDLGYKGDVIDKMYKSVRYYYKKKGNSQEDEQNKTSNSKKKYTSVGKEVLDSMYEHIQNNISSTTYKPDTGFDNFKTSIPDYRSFDEEKQIRYKKAYKNMYYRFKI